MDQDIVGKYPYKLLPGQKCKHTEP